MRIARVFNNNVVLALDDAGREVILTGRGLGFQARPGQAVKDALVVRTFIPTDGRDPDHLGQLLAGIPPEHIQLVEDALVTVGLDAVRRNPALVIAISDHISFALRRAALGKAVEYPLLSEVRHLYADEYSQARALLSVINERTDPKLPDSEAVGLALHLVNAGFASGDLSYTYTMTGVIQQMVTVIEQSFGISLDTGTVSVGRFVTHLRYLFVRIHQHRQLTDEHSAVGKAIREAYPEAAECADRLAAMLELRLGAAISDDEVSYLSLHVARVAAETASPQE
jgi:beta-glucoside operon transcriptional antiterminator